MTWRSRCQACGVFFARYAPGELCPVCSRPLVGVGRALRRARPREVPPRDPELRRFLADHPGTPLGRGFPSGSPSREDGETHSEAWMRLLRGDPCAYCGAPASGTVDHIEPQARPARGVGGAHRWVNMTGACVGCNGSKAARPMLAWLLSRAAGATPRRRVQ